MDISNLHKRGIPMKNKLAQFVNFISTIDPRYLRFAYFVLMFAVSIIMRKLPSDGGSDPY